MNLAVLIKAGATDVSKTCRSGVEATYPAEVDRPRPFSLAIGMVELVSAALVPSRESLFCVSAVCASSLSQLLASFRT
jgi:hypothetical protein